MKSKINVLLVSLFTALFLGSCGADYYDRVIRNDTGSDVTYVYDGKTETLGPDGDSRVYSVTLAVHAPFRETPPGEHPKEVVMKSEGWDYIFEYSPVFTVKVINNLDVEATLSAGEWMELIEGIPTGDQTGNSSYHGTIYTRTPDFTAVTDTIPAKVTYNLVDTNSDDKDDTFFVRID
jgi:hypothetical protein